MNMIINLLLPCALITFYSDITGQEILTTDKAIELAMENNYGIRIAKKNIEIAENNTSRNAVGYSPTLNAGVGTSFNIGGSTQKFGNGNENVVRNKASYGGNGNITGAYTLYDKTRETSLDQLRELLNFSNLQLRQVIENNILQLITRYYDIARFTSDLNVLTETIEVSNRRLERVQYQYDYGQSVRLDILNAEVDVQRDSINYHNTRQALQNAKRDLNVIMGMPVDYDYVVDTAVQYGSITYEDLRNNMLRENIAILLVQKNEHITQYDLQLIEDEKRPRVNATGSYNYSQQNNPDGSFITQSNSRGLNLGLNLNWNLFDGGLRKLRKENAEINLQSIALEKEQVSQELERDLTNAWYNYQNALFILRSEEINLNTSELNFQRTEEQFNLGQSTSVEFRQAQLNLLNAATSYNNAKYNAKVIEVSLQQLAGELLQ